MGFGILGPVLGGPMGGGGKLGTPLLEGGKEIFSRDNAGGGVI